MIGGSVRGAMDGNRIQILRCIKDWVIKFCEHFALLLFVTCFVTLKRYFNDV